MSLRFIHRKIRSLPIRMRLLLFIVVAILLLYVSYRIGDYTVFIVYLVSSLTESIMRRLTGEYVERRKQ
jgi:hypothetical protein